MDIRSIHMHLNAIVQDHVVVIWDESNGTFHLVTENSEDDIVDIMVSVEDIVWAN